MGLFYFVYHSNETSKEITFLSLKKMQTEEWQVIYLLL